MMVTSEQTAVTDEAPPAVPPRIDRSRGCGTSLGGGHLLLKCDEPAVIAVEVSGQPTPDVLWHVAGRRVRNGERYQATSSGCRHTLTVLRVTDELGKGVWVIAANSAGEDSCVIAVKTYKVLTGLTNEFQEYVPNFRQSVVKSRHLSSVPLSPEALDIDVSAPTPADWNREMEIRNRMRSVDDLIYYGRWKRDSLQALNAAKNRTVVSSRHGDAGVLLNQSYSCASTVTDGEGCSGPVRRRRLRLRRRDGSVLSAPVPRPVNLDVSTGSAALDVDSMFRVVPSPIAEDDGRPPTAKVRGLPPSGLPPPATAGPTASVRRRSLRRRRRENSLMNQSVDTVSSSFDDVQMTSSTVSLNVTTTPAVAQRPDSFSAQPSKPRPQRRRRRTDQVSSPAAAATLIDTTLQSSKSPAAPVDDTKPALWELNGEKLNHVCQRVLDASDVDGDEVTLSESAGAVVKPDEPSKDSDGPLSGVEPPARGQMLSSRRGSGVSFSADLTAYRLSPISLHELDQPPSVSSSAVENGDGGGVQSGGQNDLDRSVNDAEFFTGKPWSGALTADDVHRQNRVDCDPLRKIPIASTTNNASLNSDHEVEQHKMATFSSEHGGFHPEPATAQVSDELRSSRTPPNIGKNEPQRVVDVYREGNSERKTANIIQECCRTPTVDISAMLMPSFELQDILDTIYTLTEGNSDAASLVQSVSDANYWTNKEDKTPPETPPRGTESNNLTFGVKNGAQPPDDAYFELAGQSSEVRLNLTEDDDVEDSLELYAEMYDCERFPIAADIVDVVHLAVAEDDDDFDVVDYDYDNDDDVI